MRCFYSQINDIISECMVDYCQVPQQSNGADEQENVKVTLVENSTRILRGFVGFQEIFIHADHIHQKIDTFDGNVDVLQLICKMDIISLVVHELAHIKIRKVLFEIDVQFLFKLSYHLRPSALETLTCTPQYWHN